MIYPHLRANGGGGDNEVGTDTEEDDNEASPGDEALGAELVGVTRLGPGVGGVNGRVAIDIGTVLVGEAVDAIALALAALGVNPVLLEHGIRLAHQVELDNLVLDGVEALLANINLLATGNNDSVDTLAGTAKKGGDQTK